MLVFIPNMGCSGDMFLASLIDLGADEKKINKHLRQFGCSIQTSYVRRGHNRCLLVKPKNARKRVKIEEIRKIIAKSKLTKRYKQLASSIFEKIVAVEQKMHATKKVHLHQLGTKDTLIDILGTCAALELLREKKVFYSIVGIGRNLGPATAEMLKDARAKLQLVDVEHELTTPTGAAILTTIGTYNEALPPLKVQKVGYGAGSLNINNNFLRAVKAKI